MKMGTQRNDNKGETEKSHLKLIKVGGKPQGWGEASEPEYIFSPGSTFLGALEGGGVIIWIL